MKEQTPIRIPSPHKEQESPIIYEQILEQTSDFQKPEADIDTNFNPYASFKNQENSQAQEQEYQQSA